MSVLVLGCTQPGSASGLEALERVEAALEDVVVRKLHDGLFIGLAGEREIHVAEVLARKREVGVDAQGLLEVRDGFLEVAETRLDHGEVVVGLGDFGIVDDELLELAHGLFGPGEIFERHGPHEAQLRAAFVLADAEVGELERLGGLAAVEKLFDLGREFARVHLLGELLHLGGGLGGAECEREERGGNEASHVYLLFCLG